MANIISLSEAFDNNRLILRDDFLGDDIELNEFGLEFYALISRTGTDYFIDSRQFFERTYFTRNINEIIKELLLRLTADGNEGIPITMLDTTFGGGKTHTLVCLYHFFTAFNEAIKVDQLNDLCNKTIGTLKNPNVQVAGIDGHKLFVPTNPKDHSDKSKNGTRTIWGEIAKKLDAYDLIEKNDNSLLPPDVEILEEIFSKNDKPVLILLDELVVYLKKAKAVDVGDQNLMELSLSFIHSLSVAVKNSERAAVVLTMPGEEQSYKEESIEMQTIAEKLRSINVRQSHVVSPIEKGEVYEVIKKQLFDYIDESLAENNAEELHKYYFRHSSNLPTDLSSESSKNQIINSFPFHPALIRVLYSRVSTIPQFQKARGVLRFLAYVSNDIYKKSLKKQMNDPIITIGSVDLYNNKIFDELIKKTNQTAYTEPLKTDVASEEFDAKAQLLDNRENGNHVRVATSVFLYTLIGSGNETSRGGIITDLAEAVSLPTTVNPASVKDLAENLKEKLWFFWKEGSRYMFKTEPNLNKIIAEEAEGIQLEEIKSKVEDILDTKWKSAKHFHTSVFEIPQDIETKPLIFIPYWDEGKTDGRKIPEIAKNGIDTVGGKSGQFRNNKNLVFTLVANSGQTSRLEEEGARLIAATRIKANKTSALSKDSQESLKVLHRDIEDKFNLQVIVTYSYIIYRKGDKFNIKPIQLGQTKNTKDIEEQIKETLIQNRKLVETLTPSYITDKVLTQVETLTLNDLINRFWQNTNLPTPLNPQVIRESVKEGVLEENFAYYGRDPLIDTSDIATSNFEDIGLNFYYGRSVTTLNDSGYVVSKNKAEAIKTKLEEVSKKFDQERKKKSKQGSLSETLEGTTSTMKTRAETDQIITINELDDFNKAINKKLDSSDFTFEGDSSILDKISTPLKMMGMFKQISDLISMDMSIRLKNDQGTKLQAQLSKSDPSEATNTFSNWKNWIQVIDKGENESISVIIKVRNNNSSSEVTLDESIANVIKRFFQIEANNPRCILRVK